MTATQTKTTDRDFVLRMVDDHNTGKYAGCGRSRSGCTAHPGLPMSHLPLSVAPAFRALLDEGVLKVVDVTKPSKVDPARTMTYSYVVRNK